MLCSNLFEVLVYKVGDLVLEAFFINTVQELVELHDRALFRCPLPIELHEYPEVDVCECAVKITF
jgi:hypothetical protein